MSGLQFKTPGFDQGMDELREAVQRASVTIKDATLRLQSNRALIEELVGALKRLADAVDSGNVSEQSFGTLDAYRLIAKAKKVL